MAIPPVTTSFCFQNSATPNSDAEVIKNILLQDPWSTMPGDNEIKAFIKEKYPTLSPLEITSIAEKLKFQLAEQLAKEMGNFAL